MLFALEADLGGVVNLYVVPDTPTGVSKIVALSGGREILALEANEERPVLVTAGRHKTGLCGFRIDEAILPGLTMLEDLELYESETRLMLYRRPHPLYVGRKLFRIETHLFPLWRLDDALRGRFQYFARGVDAFGWETTTQLFQPSQGDSVYMSGRIMYNGYRHYLESRRFDTIFSMHHPFEEMAERLLVLGQIKKVRGNVLGMRDNLSLQATIAFARSLPLHDDEALRKALYRMPADVAQTLADPVIKQLTARNPNEAPPGGAVAMALDALASFTVVAPRRDPVTLTTAIAELAGASPAELPEPIEFPSVAPLGRALKRNRVMDVLLERDLELYDHVVNAFEKTA